MFSICLQDQNSENRFWWNFIAKWYQKDRMGYVWNKLSMGQASKLQHIYTCSIILIIESWLGQWPEKFFGSQSHPQTVVDTHETKLPEHLAIKQSYRQIVHNFISHMVLKRKFDKIMNNLKMTLGYKLRISTKLLKKINCLSYELCCNMIGKLNQKLFIKMHFSFQHAPLSPMFVYEHRLWLPCNWKSM